MTVSQDFTVMARLLVERLVQDTSAQHLTWDRNRFGSETTETGEPFFRVNIGQYELTLMLWVRRPFLFGKPETRQILHIYVAASPSPPRYRTHLGHLDSSEIPELETLWTILYRNENDMTAAVGRIYNILADRELDRTGL